MQMMRGWRTPSGRTFSRLAMTLALVGSCFAVVGLPTAEGATASVLYLKSPGVPNGGLSTSSPTAGSLPNYDPGRDDKPGLLLAKGANGWQENDPVKHQQWVTPPGAMSIDGGVSLEFWSAMKDLNDDKKGTVGAYLLQCNPGGNNCDLLGQGTSQKNPWSSGSWVKRVIDFGHIDHDIPPGRSLTVKLTVGNNSDDDMWFAYDTTSYPSALVIIGSTTTTTAPPTTTTTVPPTTTTTASPTTTVPPTTPTTGSTGDESDEGQFLAAYPKPPWDGTPGIEIAALQFGGNSVMDLLAQEPGMGASAQEPGLGASASALPTGQSGLALNGLPFLGGLDLVIPPWASDLLSSPMMVFGFIAAALTDSGKAMFFPTFLLLVGMFYVLVESRWFRPVRASWTGQTE